MNTTEMTKAIRTINADIRQHFGHSVAGLYNPATKLAARDQVESALRAAVKRDTNLYGLILVQVNLDPLYFADHVLVNTNRICTNNAATMRGVLKDIKLADEVAMATPTTLQSLVHRELMTPYGDDVLPVRGTDPDWVARSKWKYLRMLRHMKHDDIQRAIQVRTKTAELIQDAVNVLEILNAAAIKVNGASYLNGASLESIF